MEYGEADWQIIQTKTFTKWINSKLSKAGYAEIGSIFTDLQTGLPIVNLLKALGKEEVLHNANPVMRIQKLENINLIIKYITSQNIQLVNIGAEDIVDGNKKLILGFVWILISKMSIDSAIPSDLVDMKNELLEWSQKVTESYSNVNVVDFTHSWTDGLAFNAIIHKFRPHLVDFYNLSSDNPKGNMERAFSIAEKELDIPRLFDPEDIVDAIKPDEKSIMTYISQYYHKFKAEEQTLAARNLVGAFVKSLDWVISGKNLYEKKAKEFCYKKSAISKKMDELSIIFEKFQESLEDCEMSNTALLADEVELALLLNNIQDVCKIYGLKMYTPPKELRNLKACFVKGVFDMDKFNSTLNEIQGAECASVERAKDEIVEFLSITEKDEQIAKCECAEIKLDSHNFSRRKSNLLSVIKSAVEDKKEKLKKFVEIKESQRLMVENAVKLFRIRDMSKSGTIKAQDFKMILRALKLNTDEVDFTANPTVDLNKLIQTVNMLYSPTVDSKKLKMAFGEEGEILLQDVLPNTVLKNASEITQDGKISFRLVEKQLE